MPRIYNVSKACVEIVAKWEGLSLKPYICPGGKPTIGYGSTWYFPGEPVSMKDPDITEEMAKEILARNLEVFWSKVDRLVVHDLSDNQHAALTSLAYNIGLGAFSRSTLLRLVNQNPQDRFTKAQLNASIKAQFLVWNKVNGSPIKGLTNRRKEEAELYFSDLQA